MDSHTFPRCPKRTSGNIEVIPVDDHEKFNINKIRGIENLAMIGLSLGN